MSIDVIFRLARLTPHPDTGLEDAGDRVVLAWSVGNTAWRVPRDDSSRFKPAMEKEWECFAAGSADRVREVAEVHDRQIAAGHLRSLVSGRRAGAFASRVAALVEPRTAASACSARATARAGHWRVRPEARVFVGSARQLVERLERLGVNVSIDDGVARFAPPAGFARPALQIIEDKLASASSLLEACDCGAP